MTFVIPAVKNDEWLELCKKSESGIVYIIYGNICNIGDVVQKVKDAGKMAIVHIDLIAGLSSKEISVDFLKKYTKADGIISMKPNLIKRAKEIGLFTVQRFYMMDALTYVNIIKHVKNCDPDVVEFCRQGYQR